MGANQINRVEAEILILSTAEANLDVEAGRFLAVVSHISLLEVATLIFARQPRAPCYSHFLLVVMKQVLPEEGK